MYIKQISEESFKKLRGTGRLELKHTRYTAIAGRAYKIIPTGSFIREVLYAKCNDDTPTVLELIDSLSDVSETQLEREELLLLSRITGMLFAEVKDGVTTMLSTGKEIPLAHHARQERPIDGFYLLSEATCAGSLTNGKGGKFQDTPENRADFQCQVGRRAPRCGMYSPTKCAVYFFEKPELADISFQTSDLIALIKQ